MAKLFPQLVSSLAVLLLLRQFGHVVCQSTNSSDSPLLPEGEAKALDGLMTTLGWYTSQQFSGSPCDNNFLGITCNCTYESRAVCHVTGLDLSNNRLHGSIPDVTTGNLPSLRYLNLMFNMLSGQIPEELGNLSSLRYMALGFNGLTGQLPPELGRLRSLYVLGLNSNKLSGKLPENYANFVGLQQFVAGNRLTGQIPRFIAKWTELYYLSLSGNDFEGELPLELLFNMSYLEYLFVSDEQYWKRLRKTRKQGVIWNGICGRITERQRWLSKGERAGSRFSRGVVLSVDLEGLVRVCGGWSVKAGDGAVGSAVDVVAGGRMGLGSVRGRGDLVRWAVEKEKENLKQPARGESQGERFCPLLVLASWRLVQEGRVIRNCSISGEIPPYIGDWSSLKYLDLSFNSLTGGIPDSMKKLNLSKMFLTGNMLNGTVHSWVPRTIEDKADLSYNNFEIPRDGPKKGEGKLNIEPNRNSIRDLTDKCRGKPKYDSLYINCGGGETVVDGKVFEADSATLNYHLARRENWAYSCSGDFGSKTYDSSDYIKNVDCGDCDPAETQLYNSSRLCPLSLTYYGFCLFQGNYTVKLYFAETVYQNDKDYSNLGKRVFDVYIQGKRELTDFNIKENATGTNKTWTASFTAYVGDDHLLNIHLFWAGKGFFQVPGSSYRSTAALSLNGPLVSGISVTANFKVGGKGLSPSQIAGITAGSVFAPLLLLAFMWKMGWLRKSELDEITIEVQGKSFTLKQIIDATRKFSPKMEIGRGRFGIVYKAEVPNEIKLAVKKISPQSKQHGKDELQREIFNLKSLHHENLVQLLDGYSIKDLHLLVYDYMHKGSLHHALFEPNSTTKLDWKARFAICLGIARGLRYLHEEKRFKIVHGNIKPSNIMLDNSLTAKLSDFGLAMLCDEEDPFMAIKAKGSRVYMAPEYSMGKAITVKADVYSFGIVLLEIVSGKVSADYTPNQEAEFLLDKAGVLNDKGRILDLVDKKLASSYNRKQALTVLLLAMKCVNLSPTLRPKISEVVSVLEGEKRIDEISEGDDTPSTNIGGLCGACSRVLEIEPTS
ncbi:hypothetical protein POTOM_052234 [Populus tomentosa]|uniref:non-specific serine/threonine protein kinase n=1 Tax=Populus tomentosa TaxID=118781 RepID=A0A8X7Y4U4_POPTO|nr:hypothetical protein POTOM_052234 [Populus tomentosa]